jgi:diguanylate cyclase (GGDEF)-like protein
MASTDWRVLLGPIVTLATVSAIVLLDRYVVVVPNPSAITFIAVVFSAYIGGITPGLISAAISLGFAAVYLSTPGLLFEYRPENLARLYVLVVATPAIACMVGALRVRAKKAMQREHEARLVIDASNRDLNALRASLDHIDYGIVLLDKELRAQFINQTFRRIWRLPDEFAERKPDFVALMYHGRDTRAYAVKLEDLDEYVAELTAMVRSGDECPVDLRLASGEVICMRSKVLPNGGRMLTYANVTARVSHADALELLATIDGLTGLYNRRHFLKLAEGEWDRFQRYGRPLSLLVLDVDLFKTINDRYGHDVGDRVLAQIGDAWRDNKRSSDIVARVGGEEFALLLPETNVEDACTVAERLRHAAAERTLAVNGTTIAVTISAGVSEATRELSGVPELLKRADRALYRAKRMGRNRICVFDEVEDAAAPPRSASAA